ncbi:MAG: rod shape-determining protein MreC [Oscillospiraceae bacterium]|nr:rod shape-determining protein MreC [Oscillospiraceae bacterium]
MKKLFTKNGIIVLAVITGIAVVLCLVSAIGSGTGFLHNAFGVIASPFRAAGGAVSEWVENISDHFASIEELQEENAQLRRDNAALQAALRQAELDSEENERLRQLLDLRLQRRDFLFESAKVVSRNASNWASDLTLNKGTSVGIAIGDCVVNEEGFLVGVVTDAGLNWSTVTTILDTESQLGATVFRTGEATVARGDLALLNKGQLKLSYLADESGLINGDLIVTSGLGGYYPSNLVIGSVEEIRTDDSGLTKYAVLTPMVDPDSLVQVFVITSFDVQE